MKLGRHARRTLGLATLIALAAACGPPRQSASVAALYARRPSLVGLDTSTLVGRRILIDPGHGGHFSGSRGVEDTREADVNLGVGLYLWGLLRDAGAEVFLTRASDRDLLPDSSDSLRDDLAARVALIDSLQPDVFLSLHHNSNAELDRERNIVETYYKLDDEGPSYELARTLHRRLARDLGISRARLRPGNYFVLRNATTAAVLGEASYISNPNVESRLQLAEKQLLEAEAYFLGLVDYFSRGIPRIEKLTPTGDTLQLGQLLRFRVRDDPGGSIDPLSLEFRVDSKLIPGRYDLQNGELSLRVDEKLTPGIRDLEVRARNARGNSARPYRSEVLVYAPPVRVLVHQEPQEVAPGGAARLRIHLLDALGRPVADGVPVRLDGDGIVVEALETATRDGSVIARTQVRNPVTPRLRIEAASLVVDYALRVGGQRPSRFIRVLRQPDGAALADAWASCSDSTLDRSDRSGLLQLPSECDAVRIERQGYVPWIRHAPIPDVVRLLPLQNAALHDQRFVIDPGGDGLEMSHPDWGISAAEINLDVARMLASHLRAAGARVLLTRGASEETTVLERVRLATRSAAHWYLGIENSLEVGSTPVVLHYPGSAQGEGMARALARWLQKRLQQDGVQVFADSRPILQQTPCPAVWVQLPGPARDSLATSAVAHEDTLRERAYALFVGIRSALDPTLEGLPPLDGFVHSELGTKPPRLVVLNGAEVVAPDSHGYFRFECVTPGEHQLAFLKANATHTLQVEVNGVDSTHLEVQFPALRP